MTNFTVHSIETAPERSKAYIEGSRNAFGFVPNLVGVLSESPSAVEGYLTISGIFDKSDLNPTERQTVLITTSVENGCEYCVAAHTTIGGMQKVPEDVLKALRDQTPIADEKLEALRIFTQSVVRERGRLDEAEVNSFLAAGYTKQQLLDVIVGVTQKTLSNYANHIAETPLDAQFEKAAWSKDEALASA